MLTFPNWPSPPDDKRMRSMELATESVVASMNDPAQYIEGHFRALKEAPSYTGKAGSDFEWCGLAALLNFVSEDGKQIAPDRISTKKVIMPYGPTEDSSLKIDLLIKGSENMAVHMQCSLRERSIIPDCSGLVDMFGADFLREGARDEKVSLRHWRDNLPKSRRHHLIMYREDDDPKRKPWNREKDIERCEYVQRRAFSLRSAMTVYETERVKALFEEIVNC